MKKIIASAILFVSTIPAMAQTDPYTITQTNVAHTVKTLAADSMRGRHTFTPGIKKAADFIASKFEKAGLQFFKQNDSYYQYFTMVQTHPKKVDIQVAGKRLSADHIIMLSTQKQLNWTGKGDLQIETIEAGDNFFGSFRAFINPKQNTLVWVDNSFTQQFDRLKKYLSQRSSFPSSASTLFVLSDGDPSTFSIDITNKRIQKKTANIVGVLPGQTRSNEYVVFSAHYDHLGITDPINGDTIYNGANDNASGTTAVIELAKYFASRNGNNRTLIFVAFTGEELGGYGSHYFSKQLNPDQVIAMFNIEMIGTPSKWGKNSAYITGFSKSTFGQILQQNLQNSKFSFHPDPYPKKNLFYRSDNATLARLGVPAHTISTAKMKNEPNYHQVSDEVSTLNIANMTRIIQSIAISSQSIISGEDTPSRVEPKSLQ